MFTLWNDMDRFLNQSMNDWMWDPRALRRVFSADNGAEMARMNLIDKGDTLEFVAELPGVEEKDMNLVVHNDTLTLKAKREIARPAENSVYLNERGNYNVQRSIALPERVDADKAVATLKNGVLRVVLPKAPESKPRQITVKA